MALTGKEKLELRRFRDRVRRTLGDRRIGFKLFGSKARGDDRRDSDIDVLVTVSNDDWRIGDRVTAMAMDTLVATGVLISPRTMSRRQIRELKHNGSPFIRNLERDAVPL
jgi:predicted nucleotidyltransferase